VTAARALRVTPTSTYRVQLQPGWGFAQAAQLVPYLADLGISHVYCSPWLQPSPGSVHGYDVVDHTTVNTEVGGAAGLEVLAAACRDHGLGIVLDIVPNHMSVADPEALNAAWWGLLRDGRDGPHGSWFDVWWDSPANPGKVLVPILGAPLEQVLADGELVLAGDRVRYYDHEVPIAPGTLVEGDVAATLDRQAYTLAFWKTGNRDLDYRRFFDVTTLAGIRVEDDAVLRASHALIVDQVRSGLVDGLRVDHPDGLADPAGYLAALDGLVREDGADPVWTVVEKILEPGETLPAWACDGTTGYDVLGSITRLLVDPTGEAPLTALYAELAGAETDYTALVEAGKRLVLDASLQAEVTRLLASLVPAAGPEAQEAPLRQALEELLVAFGVYRAYVEPDQAPSPEAAHALAAAVALATTRRPQLAGEIRTVARLVVEGPAELVRRFQQTCGPVMAKGVEDTAFYRYQRLIALNEVGGDPSTWALPVSDWHEAMLVLAQDWPLTMTTLTTHDTKRGEDVRARIGVLSEDADGWAETARDLVALLAPHRTGDLPDGPTTVLMLQTVLGAWPIDLDRLGRFLTKAGREAKEHTGWTDVDEAYEGAVQRAAAGVLGDQAFARRLETYLEPLLPAMRDASWVAKLLQLTAVGIPDTYQGCEVERLVLVDPDNRDPVDGSALADSLADGSVPKQQLTATVLRLRRERPAIFTGGYVPLDVVGEDAVAYLRGAGEGAVAVVATTRPLRARRSGLAAGSTVTLPDGGWRDVLTDRHLDGGTVPLAEVLGGGHPGALLVRP